MSAITNVWRQLVQRRLWPVAIVLIAGAVAVPLTLAKEPEPAAPAPPPAPVSDAGDDALAAQPIVAQASAPVSGKRRKVVGDTKNPFGMPKKEKSPSDEAPDSDGKVTSKTTTGSKGDDAPATAGGGAPAPTTPTGPSTPVAPPAPPAAPEPEPKQYAVQELTVRFGAGEDQGARRSVKRRDALPSPDEPVLIYLGVLKDGKTAEFLVDHGVEPVGDGECRPTPEQCETIRLRAGDTEFFDVKDETGNVVGQYQLDLLKIHRAGGSAGRTSRRTASAATRRLRAALGATTARLP